MSLTGVNSDLYNHDLLSCQGGVMAAAGLAWGGSVPQVTSVYPGPVGA